MLDHSNGSIAWVLHDSALKWKQQQLIRIGTWAQEIVTLTYRGEYGFMIEQKISLGSNAPWSSSQSPGIEPETKKKWEHPFDVIFSFSYNNDILPKRFPFISFFFWLNIALILLYLTICYYNANQRKEILKTRSKTISNVDSNCSDQRVQPTSQLRCSLYRSFQCSWKPLRMHSKPFESRWRP